MKTDPKWFSVMVLKVGRMFEKNNQSKRNAALIENLRLISPTKSTTVVLDPF